MVNEVIKEFPCVSQKSSAPTVYSTLMVDIADLGRL